MQKRAHEARLWARGHRHVRRAHHHCHRLQMAVVVMREHCQFKSNAKLVYLNTLSIGTVHHTRAPRTAAAAGSQWWSPPPPFLQSSHLHAAVHATPAWRGERA